MGGCGADKMTNVGRKNVFFSKEKLGAQNCRNSSQEKSPEEPRTGRQQKDSAGKDTPSSIID